MLTVSLRQTALFYRLLAVLCCSLTSFPSFADKYHDEAISVLHGIDDPKKPVLPEIEKASEKVQHDVFRSVAEEANDCIAYYYSLGYCVKNTYADPPPGGDKTVGSDFLQELKHDEQEMFAISAATTEAGELDKKTIKAEITSGIQDNAMKIHSDCGNMSLLATSQKTLFCKSLQHSPSERLRYWLEELKREENDKHGGHP